MDGSLWCWGYNQKGQFKPGTTSIVYTPYQVKGSGVKDFNTRADTTCMISSDDELFCWGNNQAGSLGNGTTSTAAAAALPTTPVLTDVESVAITGDGSSLSAVCAIKKNKDMHCWGQSYTYLGLGASLTPPSTANLSNVKKISSNGYTMCVIQGDDNQLQCWGENTTGLVGNGLKTAVSFANRYTVFASGVTDISMGPANNCAVVDNQLQCWGDTTKLLGIANSVALPRTVFGLTN